MQVGRKLYFWIQEISSFLGSKQVSVFGCTSCGEFAYNEREQVISERALSCLLMELAPETFGLQIFDGREDETRLLAFHARSGT